MVPEEREITAADAWELRCRQAEEDRDRDRAKILDLQEQIVRLSRSVLRGEQARRESERVMLLNRVGMRPGDELVEREGSYFVVSNGKSESVAPMEGSMDPGGAPAANDAPEEGAGGE